MAANSREQKIIQEAFARFFTATTTRLKAVETALGDTNIPDVPESRRRKKRAIPTFVARSPFGDI
jgi:GMP synthase PP-ATPase subunit|tara:strand:+ start:150 stop:344 length:195 start_codon:yes stop_codon:yes gene_type:complete